MAEAQFMSLESKITSLIIENVFQIRTESSVRDAAASMLEKDIGSLVVVGPRGPIGIVTDRDILRKVTAVGANPDKVKIKDIMSLPLIAVLPDTSVGEAAKKMTDNKIKRLAVMNDAGAFLGLVTMTDIIAWMAKQEELSDSLKDFVTHGAP